METVSGKIEVILTLLICIEMNIHFPRKLSFYFITYHLLTPTREPDSTSRGDVHCQHR